MLIILHMKTIMVYFPLGYVMLNDYNGQVDKWYLGGEFNLETLFSK